MPTIPLAATIACCAASGVFGFVLAFFLVRRGTAATAKSAGSSSHAEDEPDESEKQIRLMVESLYKLTSQVDSQVGEHSLRVSEITNTLESPTASNPTMVLAAGKLLVTANQKLQADLEEAKSEIQRQRQQADACMVESRTDALTNLANRRAFDLEISRAFAQRRRDHNPFSLLFIDVDHFKRINDQYGHMVGDQLLKGFSRCLSGTLRDTDFVARYGGEEFVAILSNTPLSEANKAADRIRTAIADNRFRVGDLEIRITASLGTKEAATGESETELIEKADAALYAAKKSGRNRCYFHDGESCQQFIPVVKVELAEGETPPVDGEEPSPESTAAEPPADETPAPRAPKLATAPANSDRKVLV